MPLWTFTFVYRKFRFYSSIISALELSAFNSAIAALLAASVSNKALVPTICPFVDLMLKKAFAFDDSFNSYLESS